MNSPLAETTRLHTLLIQCALQIDESRAYWQHADGTDRADVVQQAFDECWFGARRLPYVRRLMANLRLRFDEYPEALKVLHGWREMSAESRRLICHWHLQLADPLYRQFTGVYLAQRRAEGKQAIRRTIVVQWIDQMCPARWQISTRIQFTRKLIHSAEQAGLLVSKDDTAELQTMRVDDVSLTYLMYLLRFTRFDGTLLQNPYVASLGLDADEVFARLRRISAVGLLRQSGLQEFNWQYDSLEDWARASGILASRSTMTGEVA